MTLADKIIMLRKRQGWSQEELALEYLTLSKKNAPLMAVAVFFCVIQYSWFIWAIAGVLYGAVAGIMKLLHRA